MKYFTLNNFMKFYITSLAVTNVTKTCQRKTLKKMDSRQSMIEDCTRRAIGDSSRNSKRQRMRGTENRSLVSLRRWRMT